MPDEPFFVTLKNRGRIIVSGGDRISFLQGLLTNDVTKASNNCAIYTCLLNAQGRFLHDMFITVDGDNVVIDCEGGERADDLVRRFTIYKMRADVALHVENTVNVYVTMGTPHGNADPRHDDIGYRSFNKPDAPEQDFEMWDKHRIRHTIPDGSRDIIPEQSTLLECGIDRLNGIDFKKGCYIGQELTARMHYRGLLKKRLYAVKGDLSVLKDVRSTCNDIGLAMIKDKDLDALPDGVTLL